MRILPASLQREQRARNQREAHRDYSVHSCAYRALHESAEDVTEYPAKKIKRHSLRLLFALAQADLIGEEELTADDEEQDDTGQNVGEGMVEGE